MNEHRTAEESTQEFADARAATYARANSDFGIGTNYGLHWAVVVILLYIGLT